MKRWSTRDYEFSVEAKLLTTESLLFQNCILVFLNWYLEAKILLDNTWRKWGCWAKYLSPRLWEAECMVGNIFCQRWLVHGNTVSSFHGQNSLTNYSSPQLHNSLKKEQWRQVQILKCYSGKTINVPVRKQCSPYGTSFVTPPLTFISLQTKEGNSH